MEEAFERYSSNGGLMLSFNGGKDCTALLHIVLAVKRYKGIVTPLRAVYFRPPNPFPEVEQFVQDTQSRLVPLTSSLFPKRPNILRIYI